MSRTVMDRYRRWFAYEQDAHHKTLASLQAIPSDRRAAFQKAVDWFAHIIAARGLWLYRLGGASQAPHEIFPQGVKVEALALLADEMHAAWSQYLDGLDDAGVARNFEYQSLEGERFTSSIEDVLTQLFGHSLYHRGQIAAWLRAGGAEPAVTDFVFWAREPVPARTQESPQT